MGLWRVKNRVSVMSACRKDRQDGAVYKGALQGSAARDGIAQGSAAVRGATQGSAVFLQTSITRSITRRSFVAAATALGLAACTGGLSGCAQGPSTKASDLWEQYEAGSEDVQLFTDSAGRQVALPKDIQSISPSGAYAQILLCTVCPDRMISLSSNFSKTARSYLGDKVSDLPVLGRFYGKNADMNYEEIIRMSPDVIIDMGEAKQDIASDMDGLQEQTGLPVIFIEATMTKLPEAYRALGELLGLQDKVEEQAAYIDDALNFAAQYHDQVAEQGLKVLYSCGESGYEVKEAGSIHAMPLELLGVDNVAVLEDAGSTEVSPEQVMIWAPEVLLLSPTEGFFDVIYSDATWASIPAVQNRRVYEVPGAPYEWMDKPPSVQTVLGLQWLGNLLYPEFYDFDMVAQAQEFYQLFWDYDLSEDEARELMANSTFLEA